jgi:gluconolactonase
VRRTTKMDGADAPRVVALQSALCERPNVHSSRLEEAEKLMGVTEGRRIHTIASGLGFVEGPLVTPEQDVLVTSISDGCIYRIGVGSTEVFADTGGGPNGAAISPDGAVYIAQNGGNLGERRPNPELGPLGVAGGVQVVRDGTCEWLTLDPVTPNDLCFGPDGSLYVTDPSRRRSDDSRLWCVDPQTGQADLLMSVPWYANGIGFGPERDAIYVVSTTDSRILRYELKGQRLGASEVVVQMTHNQPDGFAFDVEGNITVATFARGGTGDVQTWSRDGELLDILRPGSSEFYTNVALTDRELIITDASGGAVVTVDWPVAALPLHPFRGSN